MSVSTPKKISPFIKKEKTATPEPYQRKDTPVDRKDKELYLRRIDDYASNLTIVLGGLLSGSGALSRPNQYRQIQICFERSTAVNRLLRRLITQLIGYENKWVCPLKDGEAVNILVQFKTAAENFLVRDPKNVQFGIAYRDVIGAALKLAGDYCKHGGKYGYFWSL